LAYHPALQIRLLREIFRESGIHLGEVGTRRVLEFTRTGESGRSHSLPGGFRFSREFELLRLHRPGEEDTSGTRVLVVPDQEEGSGLLRLGGKVLEVTWGPVRPVGSADLLEIPSSDLAFPLKFRAWAAGDRIELPYGTKKLKKLFGEARIPVEERLRIPVLVDSLDRILWVAGLASSVLVGASVGTEAFFVGIRNVAQG
jgi:tRNA(Ile)-lysidine synthase